MGPPGGPRDQHLQGVRTRRRLCIPHIQSRERDHECEAASGDPRRGLRQQSECLDMLRTNRREMLPVERGNLGRVVSLRCSNHVRVGCAQRQIRVFLDQLGNPACALFAEETSS